MKIKKTKQQFINGTLDMMENLPLTRAMAEEAAGGKEKDKDKSKEKAEGEQKGKKAERRR